MVPVAVMLLEIDDVAVLADVVPCALCEVLCEVLWEVLFVPGAQTTMRGTATPAILHMLSA